VETVEQMNQLKSFQCRYAQGYLFSKPQPASKISEMLAKG
jgi:EAL domain-containing protein (putative c-di-GMP-specific phosphodiesterase class I)